MIIDVTKKSEVYRYTISIGYLKLPDQLAKKVYENELIFLISKIIGINAIKQSWMYIPLLHPIKINYCNISFEIENNLIKCTTEAYTFEKTGIEIDVLFSTLVTLVNMVNLIEKIYSITDSIELRNISVIQKIKSNTKPELKRVEKSITTSGKVDSFGLVFQEDYNGKFFEVECCGRIRLRKETIEKVKCNEIEKGNPIEISSATTCSNVKQLWKLLPYLSIVRITHVKPKFIIMDDGIECSLIIRSIGKSCLTECIYGVGIGLITIWDVVKKYEKDEQGQYPFTKIEYIKPVRVSTL